VRDGAFEDIDAVIATDDGWLAVGSAAYNCVPVCPLRALLMTSADGLHWTRPADQPGLRYAAMHGIARGPSGYVAVGSVMVDPKHGELGLRAAAWTSADGRDFVDNGRISIAGIPDGFLAVIGPGPRCGGGVWQSADGSAWTLALR
jgi:hypothetical protein